MSVVHAGAPVFTVGGDPGSVESRVGDLRVRAERFVAVGDALGSVSTSGWSGRAADRFRERFEVEPERWRTAGEGFFRAASALSGWADSLRWGQEQADWCRQEWARGDAETVRARAAYDADVAAGRAEKAWWEAQHGPGTFTLTVEPFVDPGAAIRDGAAAEFARVVQQLESAAHEAAAGVRAGSAGAPESRNWMESGLAFLGGVLTGAGEAVWDLGSMAVGLTFAPVFDLVDLATGDLTQEELLAKHQLKVEQAQALWEAATSDPWGFGLNVGRAVLDWDTWADDPARALGHLVPDAIVAVATMGTGAVATRGGSAAAQVATHADDLVDGAVDVARVADRLDTATDLNRLADVQRLAELRLDDLPSPPQGTWRTLDDADLEPWLDDVVAAHPELDRATVRAVWDYSTDAGHRDMNQMLRTGPWDAGVAERVESLRRALDTFPLHEGQTFRGTNLPDSVVRQVADEGILTDPGFTSSSVSPKIAEQFMNVHGANPTRITLDGSTGVDIRPLSSAEEEVEVLFRDGTRFEVIENTLGPDGVRQLVVRELP